MTDVGGADDAGDAVEEVDEERGHQVLWIVGILAVLLALFIGVLAVHGPSGEHKARNPLIGKVAPTVQGKTLTGDDFDLSSLRGRWAVVNFFATWCVPCIQEHPELARFAAEHAQTGDAGMVSVLYDDKSDAAKAAFEQLGGSWPVVTDDDGSTGVDYGVAQVPETFIVSPTGIVVAHIPEGTTAKKLDDLLERLQEEGS